MLLRESQALSVMDSWLRASPIPHERTGTVISVMDGEGEWVEISITSGPSSRMGQFLYINCEELLAPRGKGLERFMALCSGLGHNIPPPVSRGGPKGRRLNIDDDGLELTAFRYSMLQDAPDPDPDLFKAFRPVCKKVASVAKKLHYSTFKLYGYGLDDLASYADVWLVSFLHRYHLKDQGYTANAKLLNVFLQQRFAYLATAVEHKLRSVRTAQAEFWLRDLHEHNSGFPTKIKRMGADKRRAAAKAELLKYMTNPNARERLWQIATSPDVDYTAQTMAKKLLKRNGF